MTTTPSFERPVCNLHFADSISLFWQWTTRPYQQTESVNEYSMENSADKSKVMVDTNSKAEIYMNRV